jgi:probable HAF family extracellular repeat protein
MFDLGTLGGASSQAFGLDERGDVVGISRTKAGATHPFLWRPGAAHGTNGRMADLGTLGGIGANAYALNDRGEVVGSSYLQGNATFHAFLHSGGRRFDLNRALPTDSEWILYAANAINDVGQIAGWGTLGGRQRAFQLSPVTTLGPLAARIVLSGPGLQAAAAGPSKLVLGGTAQWQNRGPGAYEVRDPSGLGLFGGPQVQPGAGYAFRFDAAGSYAYSTPGRPAKGTVRVPVETAPTRGSRRTTFQVYWCFCTAPKGYVFDVQVRRPGSSSFTTLLSGTTRGALSARFGEATGTYRFRARLRRAGKASGWSPAASIEVSS